MRSRDEKSQREKKSRRVKGKRAEKNNKKKNTGTKHVRNVAVHCVFFKMMSGSGGSKSRLA